MTKAAVLVAVWWRIVRGVKPRTLPITAHSNGRRFAASLPAIAMLLLGGCAASVGTQTGGTDFRNTYDYLPVNDQPPEREQQLMSSEEQAKAREALTAARDHQTPRSVKRETK